jgi:hypothetical protein
LPVSRRTSSPLTPATQSVSRKRAARAIVIHRVALEAADPTTISTRAQLTSAARDLGLELVRFEAQSPEEIGRALDAIAAAKVEAVNVLASPVCTENSDSDVVVMQSTEESM